MTSKITPPISKVPNPQKLNQKQVGSEEKSNHKKADSQVSTCALPVIHQKLQSASIATKKFALVGLAKKSTGLNKRVLEISPETHRKHAHEGKSALPSIDQKQQFALIGAKDRGLVKVDEHSTRVEEEDLETSPETHLNHVHEVGSAMARLLKKNVEDNQK